jgi:ribosome-associated toxin RatA of RatAB toxin-antitoxin module
MRTVRLVIQLPASDLTAAFGLIADFAAFPAFAEDVRAVTVHPSPAADQRSSCWTVNFRRGVLHWNELDTVDQKGLEISFTQTSGDFAEFYGRWRLTPAGEVHFEVTYDFGVDSLAGLMDPIAERVVTPRHLLRPFRTVRRHRRARGRRGADRSHCEAGLMDAANRFETRDNYRLIRLEYLVGLVVSVVLFAGHVSEIRWLPAVLLFLYIDLETAVAR